MKLAHGEILSAEEEAALKLAEAEFERAQKGKDARFVFVAKSFLILSVCTDWCYLMMRSFMVKFEILQKSQSAWKIFRKC